MSSQSTDAISAGPTKLLKRYSKLKRPFTPSDLDDIFRQAIALSPEDQAALDKDLRAELVWKGLSRKDGLVMQNGIVSGVISLAGWDIIPPVADSPCVNCKKSGTKCELVTTKRSAGRTPKCRTCKLYNMAPCSMSEGNFESASPTNRFTKKRKLQRSISSSSSEPPSVSTHTEEEKSPSSTLMSSVDVKEALRNCNGVLNTVTILKSTILEQANVHKQLREKDEEIGKWKMLARREQAKLRELRARIAPFVNSCKEIEEDMGLDSDA
ncbi:hypothetical protein CYLTODRAFT_441042 [Cylindrobasidium torrendii FP15055 ss-10]|uniref:Uncharacterized protein n=1 Tax=Cylindrobasidium torrendii FP15055 ss-10 TaxID=1314674 RepID=A0A0D7BMM3_9AGAR|nr:hypothetical protein CYLTODRAFT_441042 [Cylindrobasidium torrendii FP15055 ss-10]